MIYLTENDILRAASIDEVLNAIETSMRLYEQKAFHMPQRMGVDYEKNTLLLMPCFIKDSFGTKLVTLFPENPEKHIPVLNGIMVLNDAQTGVPLALLNGPALTALRTAAVGTVSIRHMAPDKNKSLGIIGAGVQGFYQAWVACTGGNFTDVFLYDLNPEKTSALREKLSKMVPDVKLHQAGCVEELLENSQVIITATTSFEPVLPDKEDLLADKHFVGIGSYKPNMREFPQALFNLLKNVFVDTEHAVQESGDIIVPLKNNWLRREQIMTLGRFLIDDKSLDEVKGSTTLFKSVGMALFDVCASKLIYEKAIQKGLGQEIVL
ncbi:MAG: ornithine cyclodeaminase family protein [Planctomycetota bacterium]|jgi:ornithine cyclodeaminase